MREQAVNFFDSYIFTPVGITLSLWIMSLFLVLAVGRPLIHWLKFRKDMKWAPREDTPDTHLQKAGVPSMGGIGIIGAATFGWLAFLVFAIVTSGFLRPGRPGVDWDVLLLTLFPLLVIFHAVLGYLDDHSKATNKGGLSSKAKLLGQIILAALFLGVLSFFTVAVSGGFPSNPFVRWTSPLFGSWALILGALILIIGTSNAVNLTDGIDGLAAGLSVQVAATFSFLLLLTPASDSSFFGFAPASVVFFWAALGGACLGFLAFNKHPAKVFMGDTGSLALGAALGAGAILTRTVWLLPFIGFIFYVEMFSVILQVLYFKYTRRKYGEGKRLFRRAPLHHHFELGGWSEWRVVGTFWAVNLVTTIVGLVLWKLGILPRFP